VDGVADFLFRVHRFARKCEIRTSTVVKSHITHQLGVKVVFLVAGCDDPSLRQPRLISIESGVNVQHYFEAPK